MLVLKSPGWLIVDLPVLVLAFCLMLLSVNGSFGLANIRQIEQSVFNVFDSTIRRVGYRPVSGVSHRLWGGHLRRRLLRSSRSRCVGNFRDNSFRLGVA